MPASLCGREGLMHVVWSRWRYDCRHRGRMNPTMSLVVLHGLIGDGACPVGAVDQDCVDMAGIGDQPLHLGGDRRQFGDAELDQRVLEAGELPAAELARARSALAAPESAA